MASDQPSPMQQDTTGFVNCGRCAHLSRVTSPGIGKCGCNARMRQTGEVLPTVSLGTTCEHAKLSQKFNPQVLSEMHKRNAGTWEMPPLK